MARINLLPWRDVERQKRQKSYYITISLVSVITLAIGFIVHFELDKQVSFQQQRNNYLLQNIAALDVKISAIKNLELEKTRLLNRMKVIQRLQKSRPEIVHLFEELSLTLPEGAQILKITQKSMTITVHGIAESNSRISTFMRNMEKSEWLKEPELIIIDANKQGFPNSSWFSLKVQRSQPQ